YPQRANAERIIQLQSLSKETLLIGGGRNLRRHRQQHDEQCDTATEINCEPEQMCPYRQKITHGPPVKPEPCRNVNGGHGPGSSVDSKNLSRYAPLRVLWPIFPHYLY